MKFEQPPEQEKSEEKESVFDPTGRKEVEKYKESAFELYEGAVKAGSEQNIEFAKEKITFADDHRFIYTAIDGFEKELEKSDEDERRILEKRIQDLKNASSILHDIRNAKIDLGMAMATGKEDKEIREREKNIQKLINQIPEEAEGWIYGKIESRY